MANAHPPAESSDALTEAAWRALLALATSDKPSDRCDAAGCLALFAGVDSVHRSLVLHACDPEDSSVTTAAVDALAKRADSVGWALIVEAFATASESYTRECMIDAIENALRWDWVTPEYGLHDLKARATSTPAMATAAAQILRAINVPTVDNPA